MQRTMIACAAVCVGVSFAHGQVGGAADFADCGTVVQGVECVLFEADEGGLYLVDNLAGFNVGERVGVAGQLEACASPCQQEDACIFNAIVGPCSSDRFQGCGTLVQRVECVLFQVDAPGGNGEEYLLDNNGGFPVGARLFVSGTLDTQCVTPCGQGDGCIETDLVRLCNFATFEGCGTVVEGVECNLFEADASGLFVLSGTGPVNVGDRLFVRGLVDPGCITFCQQGDGCLNAIESRPCDEPCACEIVPDGRVNILDMLAYLAAWFENLPLAECDGTDGPPINDLLCFLACWFPASEAGFCP